MCAADHETEVFDFRSLKQILETSVQALPPVVRKKQLHFENQHDTGNRQRCYVKLTLWIGRIADVT